MNHDMKEMVESWHVRLGQQFDSCTVARDKIDQKKPQQAAMRAGKTKAYVEMRCFLESQYSKMMPQLLFNRQLEQANTDEQ